jgi:hypothetical protein
MGIAGIYPVGDRGPQLSDREAALLASLPDLARRSRPATHAELHAAVVALAHGRGYSLELELAGTGFVATIAGELRVVASVRGGGSETFYCQTSNQTLLRELAEQIARTCGPQLLLPAGGDSDGTLVVARS